MTDKHQTDHHDKVFFDTFMLVLGALGLMALAILFLARGIHAETAGVYVQESEFAQAAVAERIAPVGEVRHAGDPEVMMGGGEIMSTGGAHGSDAMTADSAGPMMGEPAPAPTMAAAAIDGAQVYNSGCVACHSAGIAGAPRVGDTAAWTPRIAQGMDTLYLHAIAGFQGSNGYMPPKGGNASLSDEQVNAAVDYMVAQSGG